jgi:hypothetical protein
MNPTYAIASRTFEPVAAEVLAGALRGVPGLTPADAPNVCGEGCGFLARHLAPEQAAQFLANLQQANVPAELVTEASVPVLPTRRLIRKTEFTPEALLADDALGRMTPVAWSDVVLLAAGSVREAVFSRTRREWEEVRTDLLHVAHFAVIPIPVNETKFEYDSKETAEWALRTELLLADGATRLSIEAERFSFAGLKELLTQNLAANFCLLVRELAKHAPHATLNHGATLILAEPCEFEYYTSRVAFQNETTWRLWLRNHPRAATADTDSRLC